MIKLTIVVLATMADNVMTHYENVKEKEDRRRVLNMNMCLAAFVDPGNQIRRKRRRHDSQPSTTKGRGSVAGGLGPPPGEKDGKLSHGSRRSSRQDNSDDQSDGTATTHRSRRVEDDDNIETFGRAADLLHSALGLGYGGGVVFMDTATSYRGVSSSE